MRWVTTEVEMAELEDDAPAASLAFSDYSNLSQLIMTSDARELFTFESRSWRLQTYLSHFLHSFEVSADRARSVIVGTDFLINHLHLHPNSENLTFEPHFTPN